MSFRRLGVLIQGLPPESLTKAALIDAMPAETMRPDDAAGHGPWSREMHLLAAIRDEIRISSWQYLRSVSQEASKLPVPEPTPRPGIAPVVDIAELKRQRAYLDRVRAGHGKPTPRTEPT